MIQPGTKLSPRDRYDKKMLCAVYGFLTHNAFVEK